MATDTPSVVIVEDEPDLAELYAEWLRPTYAVQTATDGDEARETLGPSVDVVLLDRRIPGCSGDEILETIRDRELDCQVAIVTGVDPDVDVVDLGFDDYLVKPVSATELRALVDQLQLRSSYDDQLQEFYALASKKAVLDAEKSDAELRSSQEYARLQDRLAVLRTQVDQTVSQLLEEDGYRQLWRTIDDDPPETAHPSSNG